MRPLLPACLLAVLTVPIASSAEEPGKLAELTQQLKDRDAAKRLQAVTAIAQLGPAAKSAVPDLERALSDEQPLVRVQAAFALWKVDKRLKAGLPELMIARRSADDGVRKAADAVWTQIGSGVRTAMPFIQDQFRKNNPLSTRQAEEAFKEFGLDAVPALLDALVEDATPEPAPARGSAASRNLATTRFQQAAATTLTRLGTDAVPTLIEALRDKDARLRDVAARALSPLGARAKDALPALTQALSDRDDKVRGQVITAIGNMGASVPEAVPVLIAALEHKDKVVRQRALSALATGSPMMPYPSQNVVARFASPVPPGSSPPRPPQTPAQAARRTGLLRTEANVQAAIPAFRTLLADPESSLRIGAAALLLGLEPANLDAPRLLIEELRNREPVMRQAAGAALEGHDAALPAESVTQLKDMLKERDGVLRVQVARVLLRVGPEEAKLAQDTLASGLGDQNVFVRREAVSSLLPVFKDVKTAMPLLNKALADQDAFVRVKAAETLWNAGQTQEALPVLLAVLGLNDNTVASQASALLSRANALGSESVPAMVAALKVSNPRAKTQILSLLQRLGPLSDKAVPAIVPLLKDKDYNVRSYAFSALQASGTAPKELLPTLLEMLKDSDANAQQQASSLLQQVKGPVEKESLPALVEALKDAKPGVKPALVRLVGLAGPSAKDAVPALAPLLGEKDVNLARTAAEALGRIGPDALAPLQAAFDTPDATLRGIILQGMIRMGPEAKPAIPLLIDALADEDEATRKLAGLALRAIGPDSVPALAKALGEDNPRRRRLAAQTLAGPLLRAKEAVSALEKALQDGDSGVRVRAALALWPYRRSGESTQAVLLEGLLDSDVAIRQAAATALQRGPLKSSPPALAALTGALGDDDARVRLVAAELLGRFPNQAQAVVPVLVEILANGEQRQRAQAAGVLRNLGPQAREAIPALKEAIRGARSSDVAGQAAAALVRTGPEGFDAVIAYISSPDARMRFDASRALFDVDPQQAPRIVGLLSHQRSDVRNAAVAVLGRLVAEDERLIPVLVKQLEERLGAGDYFQAGTLASLLAPAGPAAKAAIPSLMAMVPIVQPSTDQASAAFLGPVAAQLILMQQRARRTAAVSAALALGRIGADAKDAVPVLLSQLDKVSPSERAALAAAILRIDAKNRTAQDTLLKLLKDSPPNQAWSTANSLASLGQDGKFALPALRELLQDRELHWRDTLAVALLKSGETGPEIMAVLIQRLQSNQLEGYSLPMIMDELAKVGPAAKPAVPALRDLAVFRDRRSPNWREPAIKALGRIGPEAAEAVPELLTVLQEGDSRHRQAAACALARIDRRTLPQALPVLIDALRLDMDYYWPPPALRVLGELGADAKEALPAVQEALYDNMVAVRIEAALALARIDRTQIERALEVLVAEIENREHTQYRVDAVNALGELGPAAKPALPRLQQVIKQHSPTLRKAATEAIKKIDPNAGP